MVLTCARELLKTCFNLKFSVFLNLAAEIVKDTISIPSKTWGTHKKALKLLHLSKLKQVQLKLNTNN